MPFLSRASQMSQGWGCSVCTCSPHELVPGGGDVNWVLMWTDSLVFICFLVTSSLIPGMFSSPVLEPETLEPAVPAWTLLRHCSKDTENHREPRNVPPPRRLSLVFYSLFLITWTHQTKSEATWSNIPLEESRQQRSHCTSCGSACQSVVVVVVVVVLPLFCCRFHYNWTTFQWCAFKEKL